jgi:hypothetical protein
MATIDQPQQINRFHLIQIKHALRLEIRGMKHSRGSALAMAKKCGYTTSNDRRQALEDVCNLLSSTE